MSWRDRLDRLFKVDAIHTKRQDLVLTDRKTSQDHRIALELLDGVVLAKQFGLAASPSVVIARWSFTIGNAKYAQNCIQDGIIQEEVSLP